MRSQERAPGRGNGSAESQHRSLAIQEDPSAECSERQGEAKDERARAGRGGARSLVRALDSVLGQWEAIGEF